MPQHENSPVSSPGGDADTAPEWEWNQLQYPYNRAITDFLREFEKNSSLVWDQWRKAHRYHDEMIRWEEEQRRLTLPDWEAYLAQQEEELREELPPNWRSPDVAFPALAELAHLQLEEGLPLAWVPPNAVLREVLACRTPAGRRRVISRESDAITKACLRELRRLRSTETTEWRASARRATEAMTAGHWRAGQALAAIALDTATERFVRSSYRYATMQSRNGKGGVRVATPPGSFEESLPTWADVDYPRAMLVLHSLYGAFAEFDLRSGAPVPTQFTRHGTIHSISSRQYSKANALIALMHLVGLLCLMEDE